MGKAFLVAALLVLAAGLAGAQLYTAHTIDALHGTFGHWNPFGVLKGGSADEARVQQLIPAAYLPPTGGTITALEVAPHVVGTITYQMLTISMGHTTAPTLSFTFAANLPSPILVYGLANQKIAWPSAQQWVTLQLQAPFRYDGTSNLVIEFQKIIDRPGNPPSAPTISHQYNLPMRKDLPLPVWRDGPYGSGAAKASTASYRYTGGPLLMRLVWANTRTLTVTSTRVFGRQYFHLGATVTVTVRAVPGEVFFDAIDFGLRPSPLVIPPIQGSWWLPTLFNLLFIGVVNGQGEGALNLTVPNVQVLVGTHFYFQSAAAGGPSVYFTNVVDGFVAK